MSKKRPTKEESEHMARVAALGCIICGAPAEVHHLTGAGMGLRSKDVIPLCPAHHRLGGHGVAVHAGTKTFEENFGTQQELLEETRRRLEDDSRNI